MLTEKETSYIKSQRLARIATVTASGQPDVSPVGYDFDGEFFYIGDGENNNSRKFRNIANGNTHVAIAIDDVNPDDPDDPDDIRGFKLHGSADIVERQEGYVGQGEYIRIKPVVTWSWGIEGPTFQDKKFVVNKILWD